MVKDDAVNRRALLKVSVGLSLGLMTVSALTVISSLKPKEEKTPEKSPPQPDDVLVFAQGDKKGEPIDPNDVTKDAVLLAFPFDPANKVLRSDTKNAIALIRVQPDKLSKELQKNSVEGIVAYSAVCTHLGCTVAQLVEGSLYCPCHNTKFDPINSGKVILGPAPRPLALLPLKLANKQLIVAASFQGKVGV